MTTTVLAYFPSPGQGVWYLGPFPVRAYALCIIAGIIAALMIGDRRWAARGGERGVIYDIALWAVPFGLVGGRLYHVMTDWKTYFGPGGAGIGAAARIWEGGLGIWGAVALGAVGAWIGCRRKGIPLPAFGDAVAPGVVLAQAIGRLGNYFNQELYGRETTVPWGMEVFYRRDASGVVDVHSLDGVSTGQVAAVVHPTFLYELLWNLLVFVLLLWADRKFRLGHGRLFALYVAAYCVGRFGIELMRDDTATHIAGIRINVFTSIFVFLGAVLYLLLAPKGREDPEELQGWAPEEDEDEESVADDWADDLVAAAKGSGLLAAATVAGEHEAEDSAAVGDLAGTGEAAEFVTVGEGAGLAVGDTEVIPAVTDEEPAEIGAEAVLEADEEAEAGLEADEEAESDVDEADEEAERDVDEAGEEAERDVDEADEKAEHDVDDVEESVDEADLVEARESVETSESTDVPESAEAEPEPADDSAVVVVSEESAPDADDTVVVYETADVAEETETVVVYEADADTVVHESEAVVLEHESDEPETVIVEDAADAVVVETVVEHDGDATEAVIVEASGTDISAQDADAVLIEHVTTEAETELAEPDVAEPVAADEPAAAVVEPEPQPEPEKTPEPEPQAVAPETTPAVPATPEANGDTEEPKLGSTLKRLLWGAGNRGAK